MADASWQVLAAGLAGTVLGSLLQWAQSTFQARRERRWEEQGWSREDRRQWADRRQQVYVDTIASARRQILRLCAVYAREDMLGHLVPDVPTTSSEPWRRPPEVYVEWNQRLAEVEFYGSDEVRAVVAKLAMAFNSLDELGLFKEGAYVLTGYAETKYAECVQLMRRDLGLSEGIRIDLSAARMEVGLQIEMALDRPDSRRPPRQPRRSGGTD